MVKLTDYFTSSKDKPELTPDGKPVLNPDGKPKVQFSEKDPEHVKLLQQAINEFGKGKKGFSSVEVNGKMDDEATQTAWLKFKQEQFAEGTVRSGYMRDFFRKELSERVPQDELDRINGMKSQKDKDKALDTALDKIITADIEESNAGRPKGKEPWDAKNYPKDYPPQKHLDMVLHRLGLEDEFKGVPPQDVVASARFQSAVMEDKLHGDRVKQDENGKPEHVKGWIDTRVNFGALKEVDDSIAAQNQLRDLSNGFDALAKGDRGTGVAAIQKIVGVKPTGIFDENTKKYVIAWQKKLSEEQLKQGKGPLDADGIPGPDTFKAAMSQKPNIFAEAKQAFINENPELAKTLAVVDSHREEMKQMRDAHAAAGEQSGAGAAPAARQTQKRSR
ncbi:MAG: peptidoglycan-binding protein [Alphaproteobacteria bacterium]|nr:peptidoglycan-binding protein [Alphaproteobacteria bacterium]